MKRILVLFVLPAIVLAAFPLGALAEGAPSAAIDLTPIFQAVIGLLAALITAKVIPWIQSRTTAQQQATLALAVDVAVYAAEQIYGAGSGKDKLQYVADRLKEKGFDVDIDAIEAAVRRMNTEGQVWNIDVPIAIEETITETE